MGRGAIRYHQVAWSPGTGNMNHNARHTGNDADSSNARLAVLIDADNAQAKFIEGILAEVARFGEATVKRIYGDFTSPHSASWKKVLQQHAIKPVQQFAYTTGKNATDSALIIDAMDLLYTRNFDGFCLVTSDSDFTGLATRLREEGLKVLGFGEQKTPDAFRNACHKFVFTELLGDLAAPMDSAEATPSAASTPSARVPAKAKTTTKAAPPPVNTAAPELGEPASAAKATTTPVAAAKSKQTIPKKFMLHALRQATDDNGWAHLGNFGSYLTKLKPEFDPRIYGYTKLSELVKAHTEVFVTEERATPGQSLKNLYLRAK